MIPVRLHAVIDYAVGVLLILAPFLLGFANGGAAQWVPVLLGAGIVVYSLLTRYDGGAVRIIPFGAHLVLDMLVGLLLLASPWLFGFADLVWWPHAVVGLAALGVVAMTDRNGVATGRRRHG